MNSPLSALMLIALLAVAITGTPVHADEHDAADSPENASPMIHTIERESLTLEATISGRLEAETTHRLRLLPEAYTGPFHIEDVHHRGGRINAGERVLSIDPTRIDETIDSAQRQLDDQTRRLNHARAELAVMKERHATQRKQHELALARARTELDIWTSYHGPRMLKNAELSVRQMENHVSNQREELEQLEQMYEGTELDSETKEIVLERARRSLEIAEERLTISRNDKHVTETVTHPQRTEDVNNALRHRQEALEHLLTNHQIAMERKNAEIDSLEVSIDETKQRLARLNRDREQFTIRAPANGVMTPIDLEPNDAINARQIIATIHNPAQKLLRAELTAADLRIIREGTTVELHMPEYPELSLLGTVRRISPIGRARGDETVFDAEIHVDGNDPMLRLGLRITGRAERTLDNVRTIPRNAVTERDGRRFVTIDDDGEHVEREVTVGAGNSDQFQIVSGLDVGDRLVLPKKE